MQSQPNESVIRAIRRLIWLYFWLLIIEGALRKWIVPQFSDPLLVVRDPVVIAIYLLAIKARVFPRNAFVLTLAILSVLTWAISVLVLQPYLPVKPLLLVTTFGFRSNFLHLPLIWVIAKVFDAEEVRRMGRWTLLVLIPLAMLMAVQFNAAPDAWINRTAGTGEAQQITAGGGKIRPPATFSFISGMIFYAAASAAFLIYAALTRGTYKNWLLYVSGFALVVASAVSGSRSVLLAEFVVVASLSLVLFLRPSALNQFGRNLLIGVVVLVIASRLPIIKEGVEVLSDRFTSAAEAAETTVAGGLISRMLGGFTEGFTQLDRIPLFGYGLGIGTNAGAKFVVGRSMFLLSEGEWPRVLMENGPILGLAFIVWRVALVLWLFIVCARRVKAGDILPIILYGTCCIPLMNGQFGQPTNLGFAVLLGGLTLAATEVQLAGVRKQAQPAEPQPPLDQPTRRSRRSRFAEELHQHSPPSPHSNGAVDR